MLITYDNLLHCKRILECWRGRHLFGIGSILTRIRKRIVQYNGKLTQNAVSSVDGMRVDGDNEKLYRIHCMLKIHL